MSTYQFKCPDCMDEKEVIRSMKDESKIVCEKCCCPEMQQVLTAPVVQFKGRFSAGTRAEPNW